MKPNRHKRLNRTRRTGIFFLGLLLSYVVLSKASEYLHLSEKDMELTKHLLLTLIAIMGVHLLDQAGLWREVIEQNTKSLESVLKRSNSILGSAAVCNLDNIYISRKAAKEEILGAIKGAKEKVWLLGIGLAKEINLTYEQLFLIKDKIEKNSNLEVRILVLDALRSMAVFRAFLESTDSEVKNIIDANLGNEQGQLISNPYYDHQLYNNFAHSYHALKKFPELRSVVRFYAHNPTCWLAVIDDTAFFQPYMLGGAAHREQGDLTIGHLMPVFEFKKGQKAKVFDILEDHFNKLWLTTDVDLFHIGALIEDRDRIMQNVFKNRHAWLKHVYGVLYHRNCKDGKDQRRDPRKNCESNMEVTVQYLKNENNWETVKAEEVIDFSREGIALKLRDVDLSKEEKVKIEVTSEPNSRATEYFKQELLGPSGGWFRVRHKKVEDNTYGFVADHKTNGRDQTEL